MAKKAHTQWEFGDLFAQQEKRHVYSVTEITREVRELLERKWGQIWVTGEITNLRQQSSGHIYFSVKDSNAQLSCVLFRGEARAQRELARDGQNVILQGDLTVYEPRGQYQLRVRRIELQGTGALQQAFERLKQKLNAEGLFNSEQKRTLPRYPQRIGLVTSPSGAAIRDLLHVIQRRQPGLEIIFVPCRVQGQGAEQEIADAIRLLNSWAVEPPHTPRTKPESRGNDSHPARPQPPQGARLDLVLLTRGGGSLEDLWAFNEEVVARAIFESALPVVSAVGHEIDFTISDFVADVRAPTPSAAAEIITEGMFSCRQFILEASETLHKRAWDRLQRERQEFRHWTDRLTRVHPRKQLERLFQRLDDLETDLLQQVKFRYKEQLNTWEGLNQRLLRVRPSQIVSQRADRLRQARQQIRQDLERQLRERQQRLDRAVTQLRLLSPENTLERGYSITMDAETGAVLRNAKELQSGQRLISRLQHGTIESKVTEE